MATLRFVSKAICTAALLMVCLQTPAAGALSGIGLIDDLSGIVRIKSLGSWGVASKTGLPLYPGDKLITGEDGKVTVRFHDGAVLVVFPNSLLRMVETVEAGSENGVKASHDREIRLLFGRIRYAPGQSSPKADSVIITPTAVLSLENAIVLVRFDGTKTAYEGGENGAVHVNGSALEDSATEVAADQAGEDPAYSASLEAIRAWSIYATMRNQLVRAKIRIDKLSFGEMSRADKVSLLREPEIRKYHYRLMALLTRYALASAREDQYECMALAKHPGGRISTSAQQCVRISVEVIPILQQAIDLSELLKQEIEGMEETYQSYGGNQDAIFALSRIMKATFEFNSAREKAVLCRMLRIEAYTIGLRAIVFEADSLVASAQEPIESLQRFYRRSSRYSGMLLEDPEAEQKAVQQALLEMNADAVVANAAVVNLAVNAMETMFLYRSTLFVGNGAEEMRMALEEFWRAVETRDRIANMVDEAEENPDPDGAEPTRIARRVADLLKDTESSDDLFRAFMMEMIRRSMVLAPPISLGPDRDWPIILIELPITGFEQPPINDLRPASPIGR